MIQTLTQTLIHTLTQPRTEAAPVRTADLQNPETQPLWSEWLLTNGLGGYSMGTPAGINTRRYHGLLVASLHPPVDRIVALSAVADTVTFDPGGPDEHSLTLTQFHFAGSTSRAISAPEHARCRFTRSHECEWVYSLSTPSGLCTITKTLHIFDRRNAIALTYRIDAPGPARLTLRPLTALRDFHELLEGEQIAARYQARPVEAGVLCVTRQAGVHLVCHNGPYRHNPDIWHDAEYVWDARRGQSFNEDLFSPGEFVIERKDDTPGQLNATLHASIDAMPPGPVEWDRTERTNRITAHVARTLENAPAACETDRGAIARLATAADEFIVQRGPSQAGMSTIIAGYPWFSDWGRDTMISLPGLLLATGRHDEALGALTVFAEHRQRGLIPNRFDDRSGPAHYNTVDAPLWFLHAAAEYRRATGDHDAYMQHLAPACIDIIDAYRLGTDHNIHMDTDGLITAGDKQTQLTWMDAQRDGVTFTPRFGKAVEINALWHHGLLATADAIEPDYHRRAGEEREIAAKTSESFRAAFIRPDGLGLFDRLEPIGINEWKPNDEIRPNQIFAAGLEHSPLDDQQKSAIIEVVHDRLLTPMGLRTLCPKDPGYIGRYDGDMFQRDKAYHNGTVWPWLIGPYCEAVLRLGGFSDAAKALARETVSPLIEFLEGPGLGQLPEIYDGDEPQRPDGCPAQAWSVAEVLRVLMMLSERQ